MTQYHAMATLRNVAGRDRFPPCRRRLTCVPTPLTSCWTRRRREDAWLGGHRPLLTFNGRAALSLGLLRLNLRPGDAVLFPAYCCGSELDVVVHAGLRPVFYRLGPGLVPDLDHLASLHDPALRALFVIHYFGLPRPMAELREIARRRDLLLIEDCAHGLFALDAEGQPLGTRADIGIYSLRKHLPVPDGGLLLSSAASDPSAMPGRRPPPWWRTARSLAYLASVELGHRRPATADTLRRTLRLMPPPWLADPPQNGAPVPFPAGSRFEPKSADWRMSIWARLLFQNADANAIRARRVANYRRIAAALADDGPVRPLVRQIADAASPWILPVWAARPSEIVGFLANHGIEAHYVWRSAHPVVPVERFPDTAILHSHVVGLPVQQGLGAEEAWRVAEVLRLYRDGV